ncbi:NAD(P)/FAD-dependent oxidoreductase [Rhizobium sp. PL01]|uniref:NAD(P)/FAD-dependent oxidoreductase n=1 Tax=Rhizobium sp. PL01 TaxID=3085631 RepID=UPI002981B3ED|nr:NAD(P)/FAD-dependent oxidoreductase [Rhizobium sp. PL01]MDW5317655.1 NAD(P)/FAD-dependent oxidoreductase [Rhizobium sp. PL01]
MNIKQNAGAFDCIVIGAGPAGLTAAIYLARFHLSVLVIDGGKSRAAMIPVTHNHAGFPRGIAGIELLSRMRDQAFQYGTSFEAGKVLSLKLEVGPLLVVGAAGCERRAKTVLLATGVVNKRPKMSESIHDEALARGLLRYCPVCDGYEVTDRQIGVIGTGEHGLCEAEFLRGFTSNLTLISPDAPHELDHMQRARAKAAGIELLDGACLGYSLRSDRIEVSIPEGNRSFASLYPALGTMIQSDLAIDVGARISNDGCPVVDSHQRTTVKGVYAAGDLVLGLDQICHAMGQAAVAATSIRNDLAKICPLQR